ncbi:alpha/beta hydrolase [Streptomyces sp. ms191]|uniref:alpha/beta fold hydrolase n=1 Tax=unclassified Streptomyces TaxID=2593676 RepID=UPI0011CD9A5D|nr:alpha/beta hydrolase [Streptomyces sp. ms191]TXS21746.1 alpha/beta hydrolase [Streptomyces sp. ms191]
MTAEHPSNAQGGAAFPAAEPSPSLPTERVLDLAGFRYVCRTAPSRRPGAETLLVLGGLLQDRCSWLRHEQRLTEVCSVVTVDLPGYGTADFLPASYGTEFLARAVRHLVTELGLPRVNLMGACFGGSVALRFAEESPELVERMMLVGVATHLPEPHVAAMPRWDAMLHRGQMDLLARELTDVFMPPSGASTVRRHHVISRLLYQQISGQDPQQLHRSAEHITRLMRHAWYAPRGGATCPVLVATGEHDTLTTPAMGRSVASRMPTGRFLTIRAADHLAPLERVADFADLMVRFCTDAPLDDLPYASAVEHPFAPGGVLPQQAAARGRTGHARGALLARPAVGGAV